MTLPTGVGATGARAAVAVALLLVGGGAALCTVALHQWGWGLALGLAAAAATIVALPGGWWGRFPFALGWAAGVAVLTPQRPEGDFLIASDVSGYVVLAAAVVVLLAGFVSLRPAPRADGPERPLGDANSGVTAASS